MKITKAIEIAIDYELRAKIIIDIYDIDVFKTTAEELVSNLKNHSVYSYDMEDEQLSTNYEFDDIGIRPFHPKLFSDEAYMEEMKLVIDEMQQYFYFQLIAIKSL